MSDPTEDYCGCCGTGPMDPYRDDEWWCPDCVVHVLIEGPLAERTWFAQYGTDCPMQAGGSET